jgi:hypothetical protein
MSHQSDEESDSDFEIPTPKKRSRASTPANDEAEKVELSLEMKKAIQTVREFATYDENGIMVKFKNKVLDEKVCVSAFHFISVLFSIFLLCGSGSI